MLPQGFRRLKRYMNPIDWIAWLHGHVFTGHVWLGYLFFAVVGACVGCVLYNVGSEKYQKDHPLTMQVESSPLSRPQLRILRWGQVASPERGPHIVQHGFYIKNFGMGETAIGIQVTLYTPAEVRDKWTSGEGLSPSISIDKNDVVFVPMWQVTNRNMFTRFELDKALIEYYKGIIGTQEIPVTMKYSGDGKKYTTVQALRFSPEIKQMSFGNPEQAMDGPDYRSPK